MTMKFSTPKSNPGLVLALVLAALVALVSLTPTAVTAQKACVADFGCKAGREFCLNGRCNLITCSWLDNDLACRSFNATPATYCNAERNGQCVPRTAQAGSSCEIGAARFDNPCAEGLVCDPAQSKCVDAGQFVQTFWEQNKTYIIIGIAVVLALGCCACCCFCFVVKKGVGFAGKLIGGAAGAAAASKTTASAAESHPMQPQSNNNNVGGGYLAQQQNATYPPQQGSYPPQSPNSYPPAPQEAYPPSTPSYPPSTPSYPPQQQGAAYPPQPQGGSYPPQQGGYPQQPQQQQQQQGQGMYPNV